MKKKQSTEIPRAREVINPDFMGMTPEELNELDGLIDALKTRAETGLKKAPWKKNENYIHGDIFGADEEAEEGGESL